MTVKGRLDRLEHLTVEPVGIPAKPPTRALEIVLERRELPIPSEHPDMPQVIDRELLDRNDASPEARETALRFLAGKHDA